MDSWWQQILQQVKNGNDSYPRKATTGACATCDGFFKPSTALSIYCSHACRRKAEREQQDRWLKANREKETARIRAWRLRNREKVVMAKRKWREKNREKANGYDTAYRQKKNQL